MSAIAMLAAISTPVTIICCIIGVIIGLLIISNGGFLGWTVGLGLFILSSGSLLVTVL